jgi:hypothetical protein
MTSQNQFDWENAGRELGESLNDYCALVVIGADPVITGRAAVGIARAQSSHRRVAVGDLFADSPPIQELVQTEDPHGLVDSFVYGVSLSRIAYPVRGAGQLYVMPSGTEPPNYADILQNPRWHRLAAGFREIRALLVIAVPADAANIEKLVAATDGAVLIGNAAPAELPPSGVVASLREPKRIRMPGATISTPFARMTGKTTVDRTKVDKAKVDKPKVDRTTVERTSVDRTSVERASVERASVERASVERASVERASVERTTVDKPRVDRTSLERTSVDRTSVERTSVDKPTFDPTTFDPSEFEEPRRRLPTAAIAAIAGVILTAGLTGGALWLASRPITDAERLQAERVQCDSSSQAGCVNDQPTPVIPVSRDTPRRSTAGFENGSVAQTSSAPGVKIANPGDSVAASAYAVELSVHNTQPAAILDVQSDGKNLPAMTYSPFMVDTGRWFKVVTGAFTKRSDADSLLSRLAQQNKLRGGEHVVKLPFAFLIDSVSASAAPGAVPAMLANYADQGRPVYALRQSNGSAWLLIGAYETAEQALLNVATVRSATDGAPKLVYRKGRPF